MEKKVYFSINKFLFFMHSYDSIYNSIYIFLSLKV